MERLSSRFSLSQNIVVGVLIVVGIYVLQYPLAQIAGKQTSLDINIVASIGLSASLVVNGLQAVRDRRRRSELRRCRARRGELEEDLRDAHSNPDGGNMAS